MTHAELEVLLGNLTATLNALKEDSQFIRHAASHLVAVADRLHDIATRTEHTRRIHDIDDLKQITDDLLQRNDRMKEIMDARVAAVNPMPESLPDRVRRLERILSDVVKDVGKLKRDKSE